jgi:HK97 family phage portal protein
MRSLVGAVVDRLSNKAAAGWSSTTYNKANPFVSRSTSNAESLMSSYGSVSTLFSVVSIIANSCGSVKWHLYRKTVDGRRRYGTSATEAEPTEVVSHVALNLWDKPNPFYANSLFVESGQQHIDLTGETFIVVVRNGMSSMPLELWIVRPDKIEPVPSSDDYLQGYIYTGPNGEKIPLQLDQVIHIKMPNPLDPYRGLGPVQALKTDLDATAYAAAFNKNFFLNDATPGGIIEIDQRLGDDEWNELVARWRQGHQGVNNAHRVATLENGAKWKDVGYTMRDMQFTELRNVSREMIREAFGMHGHLLGLSDDINRANAEAAEDVYARWRLVPRLDRWKSALNEQLLPMFGSSGEGVEFDYENPSLEDSEATNSTLTAKTNAAKVLVDAGGEFESVLEALGLPKIKFDQAKVDAQKAAAEARTAALKEGKEPGEESAPNGQVPKKEPQPV